jgi:cytochrome c peroxidase
MGMPNLAAVTQKIASIKGYRKLFQEVYAEPVGIDGIAKAIASFERTLLSGNSRWDQFIAGDTAALTTPERRGLGVFIGKGRCNQCHSGWNLTDEKFHNIGIGWDGEPIDQGRFAVTGEARHTGAFKTPTLREISRTAPYMHDGSFETLEEVVDYYSEGVISNPFLDVEMVRPARLLEETMSLYDESSQSGESVSVRVKTLNLTEREKADLVAFMGALEGEGWQQAREPDSFPE